MDIHPIVNLIAIHTATVTIAVFTGFLGEFNLIFLARLPVPTISNLTLFEQTEQSRSNPLSERSDPNGLWF